MKYVPEVANWKSFFKSGWEILKPVFFFKKKKTAAISIVSVNRMLVNKLQTLQEIRNLLLALTFLISSQKLNESLLQCIVEITDSREEERNLARS